MFFSLGSTLKIQDLLNSPGLYKYNGNVTNSSLRLVLNPGGCVTALFSLRSVPSTAAPPTTPARATTLSRVRLAVSGLGGCYASVRSRLMRGNEIHPHPPSHPPSVAQLSVVAGLIGLQPASHQSSSGNATSSVFRKLRHHLR